MGTEEVYYQVTEWNAKTNEFREIMLSKSEDTAQSVKRSNERDAMVDARQDDKPNHRYYFVSTMSAELVMAMKRKNYEEKLNEAREFFLSQYDGDFIPCCERLIQNMVSVLNVRTSAELSALERDCGTLHTIEEQFDSWTNVWLEARFESNGAIWLQVSIKRGYDEERNAIVNEFANSESLRKWLMNVEQATKECEQKFIDCCVDHFQWMLNLPEE